MDRIGAPTGAITQYEPQTCTECGGQGGFTETSWGQNGARIDVWRTCGACQGTGQR